MSQGRISLVDVMVMSQQAAPAHGISPGDAVAISQQVEHWGHIQTLVWAGEALGRGAEAVTWQERGVLPLAPTDSQIWRGTRL